MGWDTAIVFVAGLGLVGFAFWFMRDRKQAGRTEAERDALDQTLRDAHEAAVTHADTRRATDGDLADRLRRITRP